MELPKIFYRLSEYNSNEQIIIKSLQKSCSINKSLAIAFSPKILQALKENPTLKEYSLPIEENIDEIMKKEKIDSEIFIKMSLVLDNNELIAKWKKENEINKETIIERLMNIIKYNGKIEYMKEEIELIGKNYEELKEKKEFEKIPIEYLSEIFKKVEGIKSEEKINKIVLKILKQEKDENIRKKLIESIEIRGLNNINLKELIETVKYEEISKRIFLIFKDRFLSYEAEMEYNIREKKRLEEELKDIKNADIKIEKDYYEDRDYKGDTGKFTKLHYAAKKNLKEIGEILITNGADVNSKDIDCQNVKMIFLIKMI